MRSQPIPLSRRLLGSYFLYGAACLLCLSLAPMAARYVSTTIAVGTAAALAALLLLLGGLVLKRTIEPTVEIETQLRLAGSVEEDGDFLLEPISEAGPEARGWNRILHRIVGSQALSKIEARVCRGLRETGGGRTEQILGSIPEGIAVTDGRGMLSLANRSFWALLDHTPDDGEGPHNIADVLPAEAHADGESRPPLLAHPARPLVLELSTSGESGQTYLRVARHPVLDDNQEVRSHVWTVRDVTQQKLAEQMRDQFLQTATHELRTPLTNIRAYAETLAVHEDIDVEQQKEFCNIINAEATRLSRFVDQLLDVSKMDAGAMALSRHETDCERLLHEVVEKVRPQLVQKQIDFVSQFPPKLPRLQIDKDKVAAALVNLLGNAVKYTDPEGQVKFAVEADAGVMQFHVEDTGIGISEEELPKVFEQFFRSNDPRVRDISGSGLGLAFTQEVVRLHGGRLDVHSELNKGTKFTMTLPLA